MPTTTAGSLYLGTDFRDGFAPISFGTSSPGSKLLLSGATGHYGYPDFPPDRNVGGTFNLISDWTTWDPQSVGTIWRGGALNQRYSGSFTADRPGYPGSVSNSDGSSRGAEAFAKMRPLRPSMNLGVSLYELKDLPRMLQQRFSGSPLKDISNYFLAYKFGWAPLLSDLRDMFLKYKQIKSRLDWLLRNGSKPVRTRITLANFSNYVNTLSGSGYGFLQPVLVTQYYDMVPQFTQVAMNGERWWASARWRIHLPDGPGSVLLRRQLMAELYGLYPSPSVIYKAIPWTWLIDWFTNAGFLIENLETTLDKRIAADYFYMMRESWAQSTLTVKGLFHDQYFNPINVSSTSVRRVSCKTRVIGDPFGFNTNQNSLTGMQLAILGALGMSRLR